MFGSYSDETSRSFGVERKLPDSFVGLLLEPLRRRDRRPAAPPPLRAGRHVQRRRVDQEDVS